MRELGPHHFGRRVGGEWGERVGADEGGREGVAEARGGWVDVVLAAFGDGQQDRHGLEVRVPGGLHQPAIERRVGKVDVVHGEQHR